jgi:conjugative transfer signal peptidase TraF
LRAGIIAAAAVTLMMGATAWPPPVLIVWNTTASLPVGLYVVARGTPRRGDLLVIQLPAAVEALAVSRTILLRHTPVLKPVAAVAGDLVCRWGAVVTINGRVAAIARRRDGHDRDLPVWQGCRRLSASHVFILASHPDSFDSRYYGPLHLRLTRGVAHPLLTLPH